MADVADQHERSFYYGATNGPDWLPAWGTSSGDCETDQAERQGERRASVTSLSKAARARRSDVSSRIKRLSAWEPDAMA
ncbi:hypothetical protein WME77_13600 [Sorangium sp. So ce764]